jgi:hypothetical protein
MPLLRFDGMLNCPESPTLSTPVIVPAMKAELEVHRPLVDGKIA